MLHCITKILFIYHTTGRSNSYRYSNQELSSNKKVLEFKVRLGISGDSNFQVEIKTRYLCACL